MPRLHAREPNNFWLDAVNATVFLSFEDPYLVLKNR